MLNSKIIEKFTRYLHESISKIIHDFTSNLDEKVNKILKKKINRMDFATRDELDTQNHILFETQEKLRKLETKIQILESQYQHKIDTKNYK